MKNRIAILSAFLLSFLVLHGCKKEEEPSHGSSTVKLNNTSLTLKAQAMLREGNRFHVYLEYYSEERLRFQTVVFNVPAKKGDYPIHKANIPDIPHISYLFTFDDDLALDDYVLLDEADNTVSITEINTSTRWLYGTYQATFIRDTLLSPIKKDGFPDTIRLTEGVFWTPYMEK
ncbi:MAG: hypothetical protein KIS77_00545 [Saprospiraceae bacterium]|nr:hypothetical protein [Saprospiraceae bacterium]